jgi:ATP-dependent DNA helicase DinG
MAQAVQDAIDGRHHLCVEAGTGTGKTLAYLVPAILGGRKVVISTGTKNLQEQLFYKDVPFLQRAFGGGPLSVCYMKGRSNYLCLAKLERVEKTPKFFGFFNSDLVAEIKAWSLETQTGDRAEIPDLPDDFPLWKQLDARRETCTGQQCHVFNECFVTKTRKRALESDIIIINHHLFFADLALKEWQYGSILPPYDVVIFDEAHDLEQVATNYFGVMISNYRVDEFMRDTERALADLNIRDGKIENALSSLATKSERFFSLFVEREGKYRLDKGWFNGQASPSDVADVPARQGKGSRASATAPDFTGPARQAYVSFCNALNLVESTLALVKDKPDEVENLRERAASLRAEASFIIESSDARFVYWYEMRGRGIFLQASPIDLAPLLEERLFAKVDTAVLTSATLATGGHFQFIRQRLGIKNGTELILGTPFDYMRQSIMYLPSHLPDPSEENFAAQAAKEIKKILQTTSGRAFVLFTSFHQMEQVRRLLQEDLDFPLFVQGEMSKSGLLDKFKSTQHSVLFATSSFWQGVDVQGDALSCVIIDKLPFSVPTDPVVAARIDLIEQSGGKPFYDYQIPEAIISLKQGLGRLIRSRSDRGVFSILDKRILTRGYGQTFLRSLPGCRITNKISELTEFMSRPPG